MANAVEVRNGGFSSSVTITRPNDTAAYTGTDVIGAATGSTAAVEFTDIGPAGALVKILGYNLLIEASALIASEGIYFLHFYSVTPPSALGDNAAWNLSAGDRASYLGSIQTGTPDDLGSTLFEQHDLTTLSEKYVKLSGTSLFAYLVTDGGYTPTANRVYKVTLHTKTL